MSVPSAPVVVGVDAASTVTVAVRFSSSACAVTWVSPVDDGEISPETVVVAPAASSTVSLVTCEPASDSVTVCEPVTPPWFSTVAVTVAV